MKKYLYLFVVGLSLSSIQAQNATDAIRFAQTDLNGTARFRAMSGAFGALGGDLSALNVNPAGSAVFNHNEMGFTLSNQNTKNNSNYFGTVTDATDNHFDFSQFGTLWVFKNYDANSDWKKISFAINYENQRNFNNYTYSKGINPNHSIADYFLSYANANGGVPIGIIDDSSSFPYLSYGDQQAYLGYWGYAINPASSSPNETQYISNVPNTNNFYHSNILSTSGYNGKLAFNLGTSYQDKLYLGLNLNSHFTDYRSYSSFYEDYLDATGDNPNSNNDLKSSTFENQLHTYGSAFSFQVGAIAKVTQEVRLGFSYESPTWWHLYDEQVQNYYVNCTDCDSQSLNNAHPGYVMIYPQYTIQTPSKYTTSFAYVFKKTGLISVDYVMKDYSNTTLKPEHEFTGPNQVINNTFTFTNDLRVGAEYRIQQFSLRGGYRFEQSPYKNSSTIGDLNSYSTGFGYNFGPVKFDFSYSHMKRNSQQSFFSQGLTDPAYIKTKYNNIGFTLTFPF